MKKILLTTILSLTLHFCMAQSYVFDPSFGNGGSIVGSGDLPSSVGLLAQDKYFLMSKNRVTCIDYGGLVVPGFGANGILTIDIVMDGEVFTPIDLVYHDQSLYLYGNTRNNTTGLGDMIVCKINPEGYLDSSFGNNGIVRLDFSAVEKLNSISFEIDGGLLCVGSKTDTTEHTIYFKLLANGSVNYAFDASGYKTLDVGQSSSAGAIVGYGQDYLFIGKTYLSEGSGVQHLYITKIDTNGNLDLTYGTGGFQYSSLPTAGGYRSIEKVRLHDNKLYVKHRYPIFPGFEFLQIYDLTINEKIYEQQLGNRYEFEIIGEKIYSINYEFDMVPAYMNPTKFNLTRSNLDGSIDTTFNDGGLFTYEFPYTSFPNQGGSSIPSCFIPDSDGRFAVAGYFYQYSTTQFGMIRIMPDTLLSTAQNQSQQPGLYPNPFENSVRVNYKGTVQSVAVYDLLGLAIDTPSFTSVATDTFQIDLSHVTQSGTYVLKVSGNSGTITKKIVKR